MFLYFGNLTTVAVITVQLIRNINIIDDTYGNKCMFVEFLVFWKTTAHIHTDHRYRPVFIFVLPFTVIHLIIDSINQY